MNVRLIIISIISLVGLAFAWTGGCDPDSAYVCDPPCDSDQCCNEDGRCRDYDDQDEDECGDDGEACEECEENEVCNEATKGQCKRKSACSTYCDEGCCDDGECILYDDQDNSDCGTDGDDCEPCRTSGDRVYKCDTDTGECVEDELDSCLRRCDDGCCKSDGTCLSFDEQVGTRWFGKENTKCDSCDVEVEVGGVCPGECNPECESDECCDDEGECLRVGTDQGPYACGRDGERCRDCRGAPCSDEGECQSDCNYKNCDKGCCNEDERCIEYAKQDEDECGMDGRTCNPCPMGTMCNTQTGRCSCGPRTCAGCCDKNDNCVQIDEQTAYGLCGKDGEACATSCSGSCFNGECGDFHRVLVTQLVLDEDYALQQNQSSWPWMPEDDTTDPPPDPYVECRAPDGSRGHTNEINDQYTVNFTDTLVFVARIQDLLSITCEIKDEDLVIDDRIATCVARPDPDVNIRGLDRKPLVLDADDCGGVEYVKSVTFEFAPYAN